MVTTVVTADQVRRYRVRAQQLDRAPSAGRAVTDAAVLDLGVQDTGPDGALWALANRGVPVAAHDWDDLAMAWTLRGAPHAYRRADLPAVQRAVRPFSDADAGKRIYDAAKPLLAAGIRPTDALARTARTMWEVVRSPLDKGALSTAMTAAMDDPYLRWCAACGVTHMWEMPFRLAALHAGLELEPDTSPPVLRRIPRYPAGQVGNVERPDTEDDTVPDGSAPADDGALDLVRGILHLAGPADPKQVARFLDAPLADVRRRWPADAVEVEVEGTTAAILAQDRTALVDPPADPVVRLLGPYDLFLQSRDRQVVVPDAARHRELWPVLGRPGAVLAGAEVVGTWRPRAKGKRLALALDPWVPWDEALTAAVAAEHERLAAFRGIDVA